MAGGLAAVVGLHGLGSLASQFGRARGERPDPLLEQRRVRRDVQCLFMMCSAVGDHLGRGTCAADECPASLVEIDRTGLCTGTPPDEYLCRLGQRSAGGNPQLDLRLDRREASGGDILAFGSNSHPVKEHL